VAKPRIRRGLPDDSSQPGAAARLSGCSRISLSGRSNTPHPARICSNPFLSLKGTDSPAQGKPGRAPRGQAPPLVFGGPSLWNPEEGEISQRRPRSAQICSLYFSLSGIFRAAGRNPGFRLGLAGLVIFRQSEAASSGSPRLANLSLSGIQRVTASGIKSNSYGSGVQNLRH
jgi:hypothetical protein